VRLFIASAFVLGLLFMMLFALVATFFFVIGAVPWYFLIGITLLVNFLMWLFGPYISDWIFRFFYKLRWIEIDGLEKMDKGVAEFVRDVCKRNNINVPRIGFIDDDNPTSFTYGSGAFNARIVITQGLFTYLDREEVKSVLAHELGHVVHRDFIVLTIASVFVQLFYELYRIGIHSSGRSGGGGKKKGNASVILAIVGYVFYIIGNYIVLYLSRIREYYADEFAAQETRNPNTLSSALIKIAYGIIKNPEKRHQQHLLKSTRSQNIFDFKIAKRIGLAYANVAASQDWRPVEGALLYDRYNPWAAVSELSSTHPMTGKRISRLSSLAPKYRKKPLFDFDTLYGNYQVDKTMLYKNFGRDLGFLFMPLILMVLLPVVYFMVTTSFLTQLSADIVWHLLSMMGTAIIGYGVGHLIKTLYSFSTARGFPQTNVAEMMGDIYTSPVRGKPGTMRGKIIGRGIAGFIFSEDMMFQDNTGLIYLNYEGLIPGISNIIFSITKIKRLEHSKVKIEGWFVRSIYQMFHLKTIHAEGKVIKSRVRFLSTIASFLIILFGFIIFVWGMSVLDSQGMLDIPLFFLA
jgi:Zn-dependent protease with chaperone function